ncbi:hypothetical protein [uncultured Brevundimonas sp.]|uniref:hypothetical protein n=1 Tax=uncultured Brevundimonas sp. TaxID=213418 RepID=UPI0025F98F9E|nr:hypothetical protein [uncultured Brevundimonas sp.]
MTEKPSSTVGILTNPSDDHAPPVRWALESAGVNVLTWDWSRFPAETGQATFIPSNPEVPHSVWMDGGNCPSELTSFWYRRQAPVSPFPDTHPADVEYVRRQSIEYLRAEIASLPVSQWVNHPQAAREAESKIAQLLAARAVGFDIPETLMTNDPVQLADFRSRMAGDIILKMFWPMTWRDTEGKEFFTETSRIGAADDIDPQSVRLCPGIFQRMINKDYELRVTIFGREAIALALYSQSHENTVDWRVDQSLGRVPSAIVQIPREIEDKCRAVMRRLGIAFGAFDIVVGKDGRYYFIEVNQSGQFLFFDDADPSVEMLQRFCSFLTQYRVPKSDFPSLVAYGSSETAACYDASITAARLRVGNPLFLDEAAVLPDLSVAPFVSEQLGIS